MQRAVDVLRRERQRSDARAGGIRGEHLAQIGRAGAAEVIHDLRVHLLEHGRREAAE